MLVSAEHHRWRRLGVGVLSATILSAASAAGAGAASLNVSVPAHLRKGASYTIKVTGHYRRSELTGTAYLISLIQFSAAPCRASAQLENRQVDANSLQFYFAPPHASQKVGIFERSSPFSREDGFSASRLGPRRVCAYLYPGFIGSADTTAPIARAQRAYRVTRT